MRSEVTKLYDNAGINQACNTCDLRGFKKLCPTKELCVRTNPSFTAEKQLELIKFLMEQEDFSWTIAQQGKDTEYAFYVGYEHGSGCFKEFAEALAGIINNLWQDLTEEEKQQVKGILE